MQSAPRAIRECQAGSPCYARSLGQVRSPGDLQLACLLRRLFFTRADDRRFIAVLV